MKYALMLGSGLTGKSVKNLLEKNGYTVLVADENSDQKIDESLLQVEFDLIVKSPGIDPRQPILQKLSEKQTLCSDLDVASRFTDKFHYAAVTGTNGKTTVTECLNDLLAYSMLPHFKAGNIGVVLADIVDQYGESEANIALECSSFQLEEIASLKPKVATVLNLSPDHLNRYDNIDDYYKSKFNLVKNMDEHDWFILNLDDALLKDYLHLVKCPVITVSTSKPADVFVKNGSVYYLKEKLFDLTDVEVVGEHNLSNLMIASIMAVKLGVKAKDIAQGIRNFKGVAHRIEKVGVANSVTFYNDSKATNPDATIVAMKSFSENVHLILGGYDKKIPLNSLLQIEDRTKQIYVFGQTRQILKQLFPAAIVSETLSEVVLEIKKRVEPNDVVLFSPACASYDQFTGFEQRGDVFKELVRREFEID